MPHPKTVLCYGDSNTYGHATVDRPDGRYAPDERWTGVLAAALGPQWKVIEEGLGGRTTVSDDPIEGAEKNGRTYLYPCLMSHRPLDVVVIMLGTNDLKARFNKTAWEIAAGVGVLVDIVKTAAAGRNEGVPEILVVSPPPTCDSFTRICRDVHRRAAEIASSGGRIQPHGRGQRRPFLRRRLGHQVGPGGRDPFRPGSPCHARQGDRRRNRQACDSLALGGSVRPSLDRHDPGGVV